MKKFGMMLMCLMVSVAATAAFDDCSSYPSGGSDWAASWQDNYSNAASDGSVIAVTETTLISDRYLRRQEDRDLTGFDGVLTVKADITIADLTNFTAANDYISFTHALAAQGGVSSDSTFIVRAFGVNSGGAIAGNWAFYDGAADDGGYNADNFQDSGMVLEAGVTYSFTVNIDFSAMTYDITVDNGAASVSASSLGWRTSLDKVGSLVLFNSRQTAATDEFSFSIDNISIDALQRGYAHTLSPVGTIDIDAVANELTWISGDNPDDPNLTVNSFDVVYYSKLTADVTADDPNFANSANIVYTATDKTSPFPLVFDYDTTYFWRVDSHVTWDSNSITGNINETLESDIAQFITLTDDQPPVVTISDNGIVTWLANLPETSLTGMVAGEGDVSNNDVIWSIVDYPDDPNTINAFIAKTSTDPLSPTATFTTDYPGDYTIQLTATDTGGQSDFDTITIEVANDACEAAKLTPGFELNYYDQVPAGGDCIVNLEDFAAFAAQWLTDTSLDGPYRY